MIVAFSLTKKRNEYGKKIRKQYENHEIIEQRKNMSDWDIRSDICGTLTTVLKDNYILLYERKYK